MAWTYLLFTRSRITSTTKRKVHIVIADRYPFKRVENYFTDSLLYRETLKTDPALEKPDSGNEVDTAYDLEDDCPWQLNLSMLEMNSLSVYDTVDETGGWHIDEDANSDYLSSFASD